MLVVVIVIRGTRNNSRTDWPTTLVAAKCPFKYFFADAEQFHLTEPFPAGRELSY